MGWAIRGVVMGILAVGAGRATGKAVVLGVLVGGALGPVVGGAEVGAGAAWNE